MQHEDNDLSEKASGGRSVNRRQFLGGAAALGAGALLGACGSHSTTSGGTSTIAMWVWEEVAQWKQVIKRGRLAEKFPDVKMEFTSLDAATLTQKAITALASGVSSGLPSIIRIPMGSYRALVNTKGRRRDHFYRDPVPREHPADDVAVP